MNLLDMRTVLVGHIVTDALCTAVLAFLWIQNRERFAGISLWLLDFAFQTMTVSLIVLRGTIPDWVSIALPNSLSIAGALLGYAGLARFAGRKSSAVGGGILLVVFVAIHTHFAFVQPSLAMRNLNFSLMMFIVCFLCVWLVIRRVDPGMRRMMRGVGLVFALLCLVNIVRIAITLLNPYTNNDFFRSGLYDTLALMSYQTLLILFAFVLILLINRRLLAEIQLEEEKFAKAFRSSPYAITLTRASDGTISDVNEGFVDVTGYSYAEVIGRTTYELRLWAREADRVAMVDDLAAGKRITDRELQFRIKSGEIITGLFSAETIAINDQRLILSSISDITERKAMEAELLKAQKLESLGVLAGGIAHDFNNLLTGILGNLSLAKIAIGRSEGQAEVVDMLTDAETASLRAKALTQQLLTFSTGGAPIKRPVSIADVLREAVPQTLRSSNVQSRLAIPDDLWLVEADEGQIRQALSDVLTNARQAMPNGGTVTISAENRLVSAPAPGLTPGRYVEISVRDEGIGISDEHLPRIFDPYFTTKQTGSGLGLSSVHSIVKNHGGQITVESIVDAGTVVRILLPAPVQQTPPPPAAKVGTSVDAGRVLVMDDEEAVRGLLRRLLTRAGYQVTLTADGSEAIEQYRQALTAGSGFDAVILDLTVPGGMGGVATLHALREIDPHVRAIVSSGYSTDSAMADTEAHGFAGVVPKPYEAQHLTHVLRDVISRRTE